MPTIRITIVTAIDNKRLDPSNGADGATVALNASMIPLSGLRAIQPRHRDLAMPHAKSVRQNVTTSACVTVDARIPPAASNAFP